MSSREQQRLRQGLLQDVFRIFWMRMRIVHGSYPRVKTLNANRLLVFRKRMQPSAQFNATKDSLKRRSRTRRMKWRPHQRQRRPEEATHKK